MGRVQISNMASLTLWACPHSYPEVTQSARASESTAHRASDRRAIFGDFAIDHTQPLGLVFQACAKLAPARIVHGLGHRGFGKLGTGDVAHANQRRTGHNLRGGFMSPIV